VKHTKTRAQQKETNKHNKQPAYTKKRHKQKSFSTKTQHLPIRP